VARKPHGFTLIELLVVLAIVIVIAGVLFPVFAAVRSASKKSVCISNFRQVTLATNLYVADYDDRYMPVNHQPASEPNSRNDRTWVQLVLPYVRTFRVFQCPSDTSDRPKPEATFDQDLVPGDTYSQFYTASLRSNLAYNYLYLSPIVRNGGGWTAVPRSTTEVEDTTNTLLYVDSLWALTSDGKPTGGGSWLVVPPCRYTSESGHRVDTFTVSLSAKQVFIANAADGWSAPEEQSPLVFGGAWPWHNGRMTVAYTDGNVRALTPPELWNGCQMAQHWEGSIDDAVRYPWDLR
jgi:prepilin-type N-terminal cleavage/methylation domain-containing protein/prepilin-type processing-associated H-X9-DG protein